MKQLYLCRHGETEWTLSDQHTGETDIPLTEKGKAEAKLLKKRIENVPFDAVFTSPLSRAKETCGSEKAIIDPNLVEWGYGDYEGLTSKQIREKDPEWNIFLKGGPNGESIADVGKRADLFLKRAREYEGNVAVFSHGHFIRVLAARYLGLDAAEGRIFLLSVAALCILGFDHENPAIALWNDNHHLDSSSS